jgi:transcriptional regulator with XRE-family HTH domain
VTRRPTANPRSLEAIAARLEATRAALGLSQAALCRRTGIAPNTYNQWKAARIRPSLDEAMKLVDGLGLTLDWIYLGAGGSLPAFVAERIGAYRRRRPRPRKSVERAPSGDSR